MKKAATPLIIICLLAALPLLWRACYPPLKVGVIAGPQMEIMAVVKKVAEKDGLKIELVKYNDYAKPNTALVKGEIDANIFQHQPYLDAVTADRKYQIVAVGKTIASPLAFYSKKLTTISFISPGSLVVIPSDAVNGGRALLLLEKNGLIKLKSAVGLNPAVTDIAANPRSLIFKEIDAAQTAVALDEAELVAINRNYALAAGLPPQAALTSEDAASPYTTVIAVTAANKDNPAVQKLVQAYQSDEVKNFIQERFQGSIIAAW